MLALLLDQLGAQFSITEDIVNAAAGNEGCGDEVVSLLHKARKGLSKPLLLTRRVLSHLPVDS